MTEKEFPETEIEPCKSCGTTKRFGHHPGCEWGSSPCGMYGWSITVGDLRRALDGVPDDYEVMLSNAEVDDCDISNVNVDSLYPPFEGAPGLLVLGGGQTLNHEYGYHERMDRGHEGTDDVKSWHNFATLSEQRWRSR